MKLIFLKVLFLPFVCFAVHDSVPTLVNISNGNIIYLSDGTTWDILNEEFANLQSWKSGDHMVVCRPIGFSADEFMLIDMDQVEYLTVGSVTIP